jgi:hypothetical protein
MAAQAMAAAGQGGDCAVFQQCGRFDVSHVKLFPDEIQKQGR